MHFLTCPNSFLLFFLRFLPSDTHHIFSFSFLSTVSVPPITLISPSLKSLKLHAPFPQYATTSCSPSFSNVALFNRWKHLISPVKLPPIPFSFISRSNCSYLFTYSLILSLFSFLTPKYLSKRSNFSLLFPIPKLSSNKLKISSIPSLPFLSSSSISKWQTFSNTLIPKPSNTSPPGFSDYFPSKLYHNHTFFFHISYSPDSPPKPGQIFLPLSIGPTRSSFFSSPILLLFPGCGSNSKGTTLCYQ